MSDHERESDASAGHQGRWRALKTALDRGTDDDADVGTDADHGVDPSDARRLDVDVERAASRGAAASTADLGAPSDRVLTVDLDDGVDDVTRERSDPMYALDDGDATGDERHETDDAQET